MLGLVLTLAAAAGPLAADTLTVLTDGSFREWQRTAPAAEDPAGDGAEGGVDLGRLWLADDGEALYLRLETGRETVLQNGPEQPAGNALRLLVDADAAAATGLPVEGLGAELEVRLGERQVWIYDIAGAGTLLTPGAGGVVALPTHSAGEFEIRLELPAVGEAEELRLVLYEERAGGDRLPDTGTLAYRPGGEVVAPPRPVPLGRRRGRDLRLVSLNVEDSLIARRQGLYRRLLAGLAPDVVALQSLRAWDAEQTRAFVASVLPLPEGREWQADQVADCVTVSSFPILASSPVDGNLVVYLDLPDGPTARDLVLFNVHLPCCADDAGRDRESDNLAATWRDLLAGEGPFAIGRGDAVVFAGDFNYVGFRRQVEAVRDGRFIDPASGPDFAPGRSRGSLATARLRHTHARAVFTWRNPASPFAPGRLDWVFFSADAARLRRGYVLDTATMPRRDRRPFGLRRRDSERASDHLLLVADLRVLPGG